jgi:predicted cobalt transporter CbtA
MNSTIQITMGTFMFKIIGRIFIVTLFSCVLITNLVAQTTTKVTTAAEKLQIAEEAAKVAHEKAKNAKPEDKAAAEKAATLADEEAKKAASIFSVISKRYSKSAMPTLMEKEKPAKAEKK